MTVLNCTLLSLACLVGVVRGQNLLANGSFEQGEAAPAGWELCAWGGNTVRRDATVARTGTASALIEITPDGARNTPPSSSQVPLGEKSFVPMTDQVS